MNNCPKCGKEVKDDDNFCKYCGASLGEKNGVNRSGLSFS